MRLTIDVDDNEYRTICTALYYHGMQALDASVRMAQKGFVDQYGREYPAIARNDAKAVSSRAFVIKNKVSEARGRFAWPGAQYSMVGA
jgi:hypothetical protein